MSAYVCSEKHIKALAVFAATRNGSGWRVDPRYVQLLTSDPVPTEISCDYEIATAYAELLYRENIRSVSARYPNDNWEDLPGPNDKPDHMEVSKFDCLRRDIRLDPVTALKLCDCLEYQSCETDDYAERPAYNLLNMIRRAAIRELPGYDDAPWGY